ncbi:hypothetical protein P692DRAFT_20954447 [Suillus brevipes Sb2]|nr:hypothetical protein P692DRAFT_20954447 [Suillus brevipes Sb2]
MPLDVSSVSMLEDVVIVDINDVSPSWDTYCFNLNVNTPGPKKIVLRFKALQPVSGLVPDTKARQPVPVQGAKDPDTPLLRAPKTEDSFQDTEELRMPLGLPKVEVEEVRLEEGVKIKSEDDDVNCVPHVSPCHTLTRRTDNPNPNPEDRFAPWRYIVRPFDAEDIPVEADKRARAIEERKRKESEDIEIFMCAMKRRRL